MSESCEQRWRPRPWSARSVLRAWERGDGEGRTVRALAILSVVLPGRSREELLDLPLGRRDQLLLESRVGLLGSSLEGSARCPSCAADQGFGLEIDQDLLSQSVEIEAPSSGEVRVGDLVLELRCPTSRDAAAIEALQPTAAWRELLRRTVEVYRGETSPGEEPFAGERLDPAALPPAVLAAAGDKLEELDPLALVPLALDCAQCSMVWQPVLEVVEILWAEIDNLARRLLDEAQTLALAYGWSEGEILAMSGRRRRYYLEKAPAQGAAPTPADDAPSPTSWPRS